MSGYSRSQWLGIIFLLGLVTITSGSAPTRAYSSSAITRSIFPTYFINSSDKPVYLVVEGHPEVQILQPKTSKFGADVEAVWVQCNYGDFHCTNINGRWQRVYKLGGGITSEAIFTAYTEQGGGNGRIILTGTSFCLPNCGWIDPPPATEWPRPMENIPYTLSSCAKHFPVQYDPTHLDPCPVAQVSQSAIDGATYLADVNYPDGSVVSPGQSLTKTWRFRNSGSKSWGSGYQLVFRSGNSLGGPSAVNVPSVAPGQTVDLSVPLQIPSNIGPGTYRGDWKLRNAQGTYFGDGAWYSLVVSGPQPPSGNGVNVDLVGVTSPSQVSPGQIWQPHITVHVNSGQLLQSRGDMLRFSSGTNYTNPTFDHVAVVGTINSGQNYTFQFYSNNPFQAPSIPGTYTSHWKVWANNGWVGPDISITFTVYTGSTGRPPNKPTLSSPDNWAVLVGYQPTLCAQNNGDPDGDPIVAYHFSVYESANLYDSSWIPSSCVTTANLGNYTYKWHAQVKDSTGQISDWSDDRNFTLQSSTITITDFHFNPPSPSNIDTVIIWVVTEGCGGLNVNGKVSVNTAIDGSANGEWKKIKDIGPVTNEEDAPRWDTLEYQQGDHLVRVEMTSCDGTIVTQDRVYTLTRGKPSRPYQQSPSDQFWSNTRTITFTWQASMRTNNYTLTVSTSPDPAQNPVLTVPVNGTMYTATFDQDYSQLYWDVKANNEFGQTGQGGRWFGIDRASPTSSVSTDLTPHLSYDPQFAVAWSGTDPASGIQDYDVQVRQEPNGTWTDWLSAYPNTSAIFSGQPGYLYSFRSRAHDIASNTEDYTDAPDAQILVDPTQRPPEAWWNTAYQYKRHLVVINPMASTILPAGYFVQLHLDGSTSPTAAQIYNASLSSTKGSDVRVAFNQTEVPRYFTSFTPSLIDIWFDAQEAIPASGSALSYALYYGNSQATDPNVNAASVFVPSVDANTRLLAYMDEGNGTAVNDSSGNGNNGTLQGNFSQPWPTGRVRTDLHFDGASRVLIPNSGSLSFPGQLTVEAWVRPTLIDSSTRKVVAKNAPNMGSSFQLFSLDGYPSWKVRSANTESNIVGPVRMVANQWYHLAGTYDGSRLHLFVNGIEVISTLYNTGIVDSTAPVSIAGNTNAGEDFIGDIDQVRISSVARTSFPYAVVTVDPSSAAGQELTQETIGQSDLALISLQATPNNNDGGADGILVQAVFQNQGQFPTYNEFYTHVYTDRVPSGPGDLEGSIGFWLDAPVAPGATVTLTRVLTDGTSSGLHMDSLPLSEQSFTLAAQLDSTGAVSDTVRANNIITGTAACLASPDAFEPDDVYTQAATITLDQSQSHNFTKTGDPDWVQFQATGGQSYVMATTNLGVGADTYLYLYGTDGTTLLASNDDYGGTLASYIEWTAPATGTYYLLTQHWNPNASGCGTKYDLIVAPQRFSVGHVTWQGRPPQPNALQQIPLTMTLTMSGTTSSYEYPNLITDASGYFTTTVALMPSGTYNWWIKGDQYLANAGSLLLAGASITQVDMGLMLAGDTNNDNVIDGFDYNILRSTYGELPGDPGYDARADFNGDMVIDGFDYNLLRSNYGLLGRNSRGPQLGAGGPPSRNAKPLVNDAYLELRPQGSAPPNGGTANVGDRFVLELWVNGGTHQDLVDQDSYLAFTNSVLQNIRVSAGGCVLTNTVTADLTVFDLVNQNQVCNGPGNCFGGGTPPGSIGFSSGLSPGNPQYGSGSFRIAQIGLCAVTAGAATLHWQFSPPEPANRNTKIIDSNNQAVHNPILFADYNITAVGGPSPTPTEIAASTATVAPISTPTVTQQPSTVPTATSELTATHTAIISNTTTPTVSNSTPTASAVVLSVTATVTPPATHVIFTPTVTVGATITPLLPTGTPTGASFTSTPTPIVCLIEFSDVPVGSAFHDYVRCLACRGILSGYSCGGPGEPCDSNSSPYFRPGNSITRGQLSKIISNAAGFNDPAGNQLFEDVPLGSTFYDWVQRLASRGYVSGYSCGGEGEPCGPSNLPYFQPYNNVTRGQAAKIVSNAFFPGCVSDIYR